MQAGQSVADLAQSKGISEDQLIAKIKDGMTDKIKRFVEKKHQPEANDKPAAADLTTTPASPVAQS